MIFYIVVALQTSETNFLGARFIEEVTYIDNFMHEDQIGLIQEYTNIEHFKVVTEELQKGLRRCEKLFINPGSDGSSGSSSISESATTNALEQDEERTSMTNNSRFEREMSYMGLQTFDGGLSTVYADSLITTESSMVNN